MKKKHTSAHQLYLQHIYIYIYIDIYIYIYIYIYILHSLAHYMRVLQACH